MEAKWNSSSERKDDRLSFRMGRMRMHNHPTRLWHISMMYTIKRDIKFDDNLLAQVLVKDLYFFNNCFKAEVYGGDPALLKK